MPANIYNIFLLQVALCCFMPPLWAGTIGFSVEFKGQEVSIVNKGSDAAYNLSMWALDPKMQWQPLVVTQGNASYTAPESSLKAMRQNTLPDNRLGQANPLLIQLQDQAGSRITQLAWQQAPQPSQTPLPVQRLGRDVRLQSAEATTRLVASYAIIAPYTRIADLANPLSEPPPPQNPKIHQWLNQPNLTIDTGAGQGGIWWLHQTTSGTLELQMVADGIARGTEQTPPWLAFARHTLLQVSAALAFFGLCLMVIRYLKRNVTTKQQMQKASK